MPIKNITGAVAEGEDFFDREAEQKRIWNKLQDNAHLALLAPRRVGKTSLLKRLQVTASTHGYRAVYLDVGDAADERAFVERLSKAVLDETNADSVWQRLSNSSLVEPFKNIKKIGGFGVSVELDKAQASWDKLGQHLVETLHTDGGHWLVQVDELPVFLLKLLQTEDETARQRARDFLYWLRRLCNDYPSVQWIFAGSIGLDAVAERHRLTDAVNHLTIFRLEAYDAAVADRFLQALAESYHLILPPDVRAHLIATVGWPIPYHLQLLFSGLRDQCDGNNTSCTTADVDAVFEQLLQPVHSSYFDTWRQRLQDELGRVDSDYALRLLNAVCNDPQGVSRDVLGQLLAARISEPEAKDEKLRYLLKVLGNDGYLVEDQGGYRFRSFLLREYWRRQVAV